MTRKVTRGKRGRPMKSAADRRSETLAFKATKGEKAAIEANAEAADASLSDFMRGRALSQS